MLPHRLVLGTAQFGLKYGVANRSGKITGVSAAAILRCAWSHGIGTLDTAVAYGDCETRLGEAGVSMWKVVSKLPQIPGECADVSKWVIETVQISLRRLKVAKLYGLLLHHPQDLLSPQGEQFSKALRHLQEANLVEKIGVSIYDCKDFSWILPRFAAELVQVPFNILDRTLETSGWLSKLNEAKIEIHTRSAFLQGLLLMQPSNRPRYFERWRPLLNNWDRWVAEHQLTPVAACLGFVASRPEINGVVVGIDNQEQLEEIVASIGAPVPCPPADLVSTDRDLIHPSRWNLA